ncbi:hypothetical protein KVG96_12845 [Pseudomonas sp. COR58]|uniref:Uncharacterized protein n=1 Tax=Pseudomonas ekonensis TaxID=2842353 RepID=A0ABS6PED5_9PSED|nr:hypothetical protein [Pseudomonas ekonensis]MBV4458841.1 hypothetical protein [Pseudomonas ekonensis]
MHHSNYPRLKVFLAFLLCPLVPGFIAGIVKTVATVAHLAMNPRLIGEVGPELMMMPFLAPVLALLIFIVPFLLFSSAIAGLKVTRTVRACATVALVGACVATLWVVPFVVAVFRDDPRGDGLEYALELAVLFAVSTATCWLTARFFLPEPVSLEVDSGPGVDGSQRH